LAAGVYLYETLDPKVKRMGASMARESNRAKRINTSMARESNKP
jgi:hypothetical protein